MLSSPLLSLLNIKQYKQQTNKQTTNNKQSQLPPSCPHTPTPTPTPTPTHTPTAAAATATATATATAASTKWKVSQPSTRRLLLR